MITYPLNNIDYTAEDAELYFSTRESGVYDGNDFEVTVSGIDNDVTVGTGIAWIHNTKFSGKVIALKEPKTLTLSLPNSVYDRIDSIVIQFDANENATEIVVKEGIASSMPVAPNVVRTESLYELHIFHVQRKAGATVISIDDLVDLRNDSDYCGIMFDSISSIDSTLTKSGYAADSAETGKQIKRATTVLNLLDNSDFRNPVNQRGSSNYASEGYTVDRWRLSTDVASNSVSLVDGGLALKKGTSGQYFTFLQRTESANMNVVNTFAICDSNNDIYVLHSVPNDRIENVVEFGTMIVNQTGDATTCSVTLNNGREITLKWAALYEGEYTAETLPPYVPKGYSAELAECERYYREIPAGSSLCGVIMGDGAQITVNYPHNMRVNPTVIVDNFNGTIATIIGGKAAVSHISYVWTGDDTLVFAVSSTMGSNLNWTPVVIRLDNVIKLNANL